MSRRRTKSAGKGSSPSRSTGNPSQPRCTNAESQKRTSQVFTWILEGVPSHRIVEKVEEAWGVGESMARNYITKASELLREESAKRAATTLEDHLNARWHLYSRACEAGDMKTAAMILKDIGRLQALYATDRSLLAKAGLDESLTAAMADPDERAADLLRRAREIRGDG